MTNPRQFTVAEIATELDAELSCPAGAQDRLIGSVAPLQSAGADELSYCLGGGWERLLSSTAAGAVIVEKIPQLEGLCYLLVADAQVAFAKAVSLLHPDEHVFEGVHPSAAVDPGAVVADPVTIGPHVSIGAGARIGARCVLLAGCAVGAGVTLGCDCRIGPNVVITAGATIGDRALIHGGAVIGADGFGMAQRGGRQIKIPQIGSVRIGADVEIGANTCVDRGALGDTVIGDGVKADNLVQVGHNVQIGDHSVLVAQVGLAGSCRIGKEVILAGRAGVKEHVTVGDGAILATASIATHDIKPGTVAAGYPAVAIEDWRKAQVILRNLPRHWPQIRRLIKRFEQESR